MIQKVISLSETGLCRQENQDAVLAMHTEHVGLFAVADGIGGHYKGELASQKVVDSLKIWWNEIQGCALSIPFAEIINDLEKKVWEINKNIFEMYHKIGQKGGTTLCLLFVHKNSYAVLNIGDSRLYRCQGWSCKQMTIDDVWENQAYIIASMDEKTIQNSSSYGKLVCALGIQENLEIAIHTGKLSKRIQFLLCSDGIYKYCDNTYLFSQLRYSWWRKNVNVIAQRIKAKVYKNGAKDNLSIVLVLVGKDKKE